MTALPQSSSASSPLKGEPFRVMVVDDSAVIRGFIARWLEADPEITVVSSASNGDVAVKSLVGSRAEVVILDIEMPVMDGLTALPKLIERVPDIKVVMASTLTLRNADISMQALSLGAADYVPKPESSKEVNASEEFRANIIGKIKALAAARRRERGEELPSNRRYGAVTKGPQATAIESAGFSADGVPKTPAGGAIALVRPSPVPPRIMGIGSSTGGPQALMEFMKAVAPSLKIPVLITQHMPPTFTTILAEHIAKATGLTCSEGKDGERIIPGQVYVAPGDYHMQVQSDGAGYVLKLNQGPQEHFCRPSVNPMFRSIAQNYKNAALCVMLTGMGADGIEGSKELVEKGGTLIAQDEETSVVWGMPGAVALAGICSAVLPLKKLGGEAVRLITGAAK